MKDHRKLLVWQKSHQLTLDVHKSLNSFPKEEMFGLTVQMKRSANRFRQLLLKDVVEIQTGIFEDFSYEEVKKMLSSLINKLAN